MNKEVIEKYKLQEAVKRFKQINEYTFITAPMISEDGEDDNNGNAQNDGGNQQGGGQMQTPDNGNMGGKQGGDMQSPDASQQPADNGQIPPMNGNDSGGQGMNNGGQMPPMDNTPADNSQGGEDGNADSGVDFSMGDEDDIETEEMEPDDEVIDVDDLTQSQETTEVKVDSVNKKITDLLKVVEKFADAISQTDSKIEGLKQEFEKRNPTPEEKLNLRSQASYPYSEMPKEYWDKKTKENPHYNVIADNDVPAQDEQQKFEIKKSDIGNNFNYQSISDSFDEPLKFNDFLKF